MHIYFGEWEVETVTLLLVLMNLANYTLNRVCGLSPRDLQLHSIWRPQRNPGRWQTQD